MSTYRYKRHEIGRRDKLVAVYSVTEAPGAYGQAVQAETLIGSYWMSLVPERGREILDAAKTKAEYSHRGSMAREIAIDPSMRIGLGSRRFNIVACLDTDEQGADYDLYLTEVL